MKNKISLKLLTLLALTGEMYAKSTPVESTISFLTPPTNEAINSFMLTPLELIKPVSFEPNSFIDFSIAMNIFWF